MYQLAPKYRPARMVPPAQNIVVRPAILCRVQDRARVQLRPHRPRRKAGHVPLLPPCARWPNKRGLDPRAKNMRAVRPKLRHPQIHTMALVSIYSGHFIHFLALYKIYPEFYSLN